MLNLFFISLISMLSISSINSNECNEHKESSNANIQLNESLDSKNVVSINNYYYVAWNDFLNDYNIAFLLGNIVSSDNVLNSGVSGAVFYQVDNTNSIVVTSSDILDSIYLGSYTYNTNTREREFYLRSHSDYVIESIGLYNLSANTSDSVYHFRFEIIYHWLTAPSYQSGSAYHKYTYDYYGYPNDNAGSFLDYDFEVSVSNFAGATLDSMNTNYPMPRGMYFVFDHNNTYLNIFNNFVNYNESYDDGYQRGYSDGVSYGYNQGYSDGSLAPSGVANEIFSGFFTIGMLPVNVFLTILNFEVFGINISGLVTGILTVSLVIIVIRFIVGRKNND